MSQCNTPAVTTFIFILALAVLPGCATLGAKGPAQQDKNPDPFEKRKFF
jgi:outer membrane biogenesis lipoprotein LolB